MSELKTAPVVIGEHKVAVWKEVFTPAELDRIMPPIRGSMDRPLSVAFTPWPICI